jgi:hypothetical protein
MANAERGEVNVEVEGKPYTLRPTFDSLCELEELVGRPIDQIMSEMQQGRLSGVRSVMWCMLQDAHAKEFPTLKHASRFIEAMGGVDKAIEVLYRVMGLNLEEAPADANPPDAQAGTGNNSGTTPVALA